jgi:hypothetical protein
VLNDFAWLGFPGSGSLGRDRWSGSLDVPGSGPLRLPGVGLAKGFDVPGSGHLGRDGLRGRKGQL